MYKWEGLYEGFFIPINNLKKFSNDKYIELIDSKYLDTSELYLSKLVKLGKVGIDKKYLDSIWEIEEKTYNTFTIKDIISLKEKGWEIEDVQDFFKLRDNDNTEFHLYDLRTIIKSDVNVLEKKTGKKKAKAVIEYIKEVYAYNYKGDKIEYMWIKDLFEHNLHGKKEVKYMFEKGFSILDVIDVLKKGWNKDNADELLKYLHPNRVSEILKGEWPINHEQAIERA